jgi:hypothetical protein
MHGCIGWLGGDNAAVYQGKKHCELRYRQHTIVQNLDAGVGTRPFLHDMPLAYYLLLVRQGQSNNRRSELPMSGFIYRFECVSADCLASPSQTAEKILSSATFYVRGIRFYELTDRRNPKPLFAVLFAHHAAKHYFEEVFECLLERSGLRFEIAWPVEGESFEQLDLNAIAANSTEFDQQRLAQGGSHPVPPSLKEWVLANSK